ASAAGGGPERSGVGPWSSPCSSLPEARAEALPERSDDGSDDAVDLLVGQRALVVAQLEAHGEAALACGEAGSSRLRLEDIEQRRRADRGLVGGIDRRHQRVV